MNEWNKHTIHCEKEWYRLARMRALISRLTDRPLPLQSARLPARGWDICSGKASCFNWTLLNWHTGLPVKHPPRVYYNWNAFYFACGLPSAPVQFIQLEDVPFPMQNSWFSYEFLSHVLYFWLCRGDFNLGTVDASWFCPKSYKNNAIMWICAKWCNHWNLESTGSLTSHLSCHCPLPRLRPHQLRKISLGLSQIFLSISLCQVQYHTSH